MATSIKHLHLELAHLDHFKDKIPGIKNLCTTTLAHLSSLGGLQVSTLFEHALANEGGHELVSLDKGDLERNGEYSDAKLATARTCSNGTTYSAPVKGLHTKVGPLRVQVYERKQHKFYYFVIPNSAYSHIAKSSNIEIPFDLDGTPRRITSRTVAVNWWDFEVSDWKILATQ